MSYEMLCLKLKNFIVKERKARGGSESQEKRYLWFLRFSGKTKSRTEKCPETNL